MAYSDEALKAKLSTLNETQDSIVSVSQWVIFHRRHAGNIANLWHARLRELPPPKRLNYIYLVNDVVQSARARKRSEFPDAFSPIIADAVQTAYRSATSEVQVKIRRVVEVWRSRNVFEVPIQDAIESRLGEVDKTKGTTTKKPLMGGSIYHSSSSAGMPKEIETLGPLQITTTKAVLSAKSLVDAAQSEYTKLNAPDASLPSPPVHAARLSALMKSLAGAEVALAESIKARKALIADMERLMKDNQSALAKDEEVHSELQTRAGSTETKKKEVEDAIMKGLTEDTPPTNGNGMPGDDGKAGPERPEFEAFTPEATTPTGTPPLNPQEIEPPVNSFEVQSILAGMSGGTSRIRPASEGSLNGYNVKRQKMSQDEDAMVPDLGDLDQDVEELLRQESARV